MRLETKSSHQSESSDAAQPGLLMDWIRGGARRHAAPLPPSRRNAHPLPHSHLPIHGRSPELSPDLAESKDISDESET